MSIRKIAVAAATLLTALSPALANASPERASAKACARAFAASITTPGIAAPVFKLAYRGDAGSSMLSDFYPTDYTFTLEARASKSGVAVARATCTTNSRGVVTTIAAIPLDAKPATLAAGF